MKYTIFSAFIIFGIFFSNTTLAQFENILEPSIEVSVVPPSPKPGELVYISVNSYATNINSAKITWYLNGTVSKKGVGDKNFSVVAGEMGVVKNVTILVETIDGEVVEKSITIKPSSVDMIWESEGITPPFYKSKTLFAHQNIVRVIAIPHITSPNGSEFNPSNLIYKWKVNGGVIDNQSGYGRNSFVYVPSVISRPAEIGVEVTTGTTNDISYANVNLNPIDPEIIFYTKDPIYGIQLQNALIGNVDLEKPETTIIGIPLYFDANQNNLSFRWSINNTYISNDPKQNVQVFRKIEGAKGSSKISLSIDNADKILQLKKQDIFLRFNE